MHLDDVYWAREGRRSVDAAVIAIVALGLLVVGARPLDINLAGPAQVIATVIGVAIIFICVAISLVKQRVAHAVLGVWVFPVAIYAASRLGKPYSPWARRFYGDRNPRKQARAQRRFAPRRRTDRFKERLRDTIGGTTTQTYDANLAGRPAESDHDASLEAAAEVKRRAARRASAEKQR